MIEVRTLTTVGGNRPGKSMTRKKNRQARKLGFVDYQAMIAHMLNNQSLFNNLVRIAQSITARKLAA